MNKEQLIAYYHRFCRWQHEVPHYVNRHEDTVQHCHNCGTAFSDNFCPRCGQRAEVGRVGWKSLKENIALLWGMDSRSLSYTLFQLLTRPGYLVRDYISGRRQVSFPPVKMLVIVSLFMVIFESVIHLENEVVSIHFNIPEIDNVIKWFNDNKSWGTLFYHHSSHSLDDDITVLLVAFLFSNDDRKDDVINAGLWLLAIVILLVAVTLFVTYRISRKKESNYVRTN